MARIRCIVGPPGGHRPEESERVFDGKEVRSIVTEPVDYQQPFSMHDQDAVWLVEHGQVDLFTVAVSSAQPPTAGGDGVAAVGQTGRWHHVERIDAGTVMWGMPDVDTADGPGVMLLCQPLPGARLRRASRKQLLTPSGGGPFATGESSTAGVPLVAGLQQWLAVLVGAAGGTRIPGTWTGISAAEPGSDEYAPGTALVPTEFVWVRHDAGASNWCARPDLSVTSAHGFIGLPTRAWLDVTATARLTVVTTDELAQDSSALLPAVDETHRLLLRSFAGDMAAAERAAAVRLAARRRHDRALMEDALKRLASSAPTGRGGGDWIAGDDGGAGVDDPLFTACRLVGNAQGITMKPPPTMLAGRPGPDPITDIALASQVQVRPVRLRGRWWREDNGPLLGFIDEDNELHPVALLPRSPWSYDMLDPRTNRRVRVTDDVARQFHDQAFMFYPSLPARAVTGWDLLRLGARSIWARDLLVVLAMGLAVGGLGMLIPIVTGDLFDRVIPQADTSHVWPLALLLVASAFGTLLFEFTRSIAMQRVEGRLEMATQAAVWDRVINLPPTFFRDFSSGDLAVRAMGINAIRAALSGVALTTILSSVFSVFNFGLLFYYDRRLATVATAVLAFSLVLSIVLGYFGVRLQRTLTDMQGRISGLVLQLINGINKFRMAGAEERAFFLWAKEFSRQRRVTYSARTIQNVQTTVHAVLPVATNVVLFTAFMSGASGDGAALSTGHFLAFMTAFGIVNGALMSLAATVLALLGIVPYYERAKPILDAAPEIDESREDPGQLAGEIELSHVSFRYADDGPLIVDDVSMHVRPGEFVAIVGPSGQGKSTLLRLLLGFEKPLSGSIYYDGKDLDTLDLRAVRRQIGVVLQNGTLTQGDIYSNIVGAANISMDEAWEAARMAGLAADIEQMPMGMHTMIPDGGGTLSGGQRQRLLIARALVRKPRILLFDEATSALDNETQGTVMRSLADLRATRVVIAHRLSTVIHADRIFVLNRGRIVQQGTYSELMAQQGMFAELARRQLA